MQFPISIETDAMRKLLTLLLLLTAPVFAQSPEFYIVPGERIGPVTRNSTKSNLIRALGQNQVKDSQVNIGEGETADATTLYPEHPHYRIKIIWKPGSTTSATPESVWLQGESSVWRTEDGIGLGTGLARAEKANRGPFELMGFGWDYEGNVNAWNGRLTNKLKDLSVRFTMPPKSYEFYGHETLNSVLGDMEITSQHPLFLKVDPIIHHIVMTFE